MMYRFLIVIEKANENYSACAPDLPGCIATGATREEAKENVFADIQLHVLGLQEDNEPIPDAVASAEYIPVL